MKIIVGSRGSALALKQSELVIDKLKEVYPEHDYMIKVIHTKGDIILDVSLDKMNDKGIFVKEIEKELLDGTIDLAVHSLKDMPSIQPDGLVYAATIEASDHRDCLILSHHKSLDDLPLGATIATGSKRRRFQLLKLRPDLHIVDIRGNVNTRLKKMEDQKLDGLVLASAGLIRLGMENIITEYFDEDRMVPACGQGILALQVKQGSPLIDMIENISDKHANLRLDIERAFLLHSEGSCHIPIGSYASINGDQVKFTALLGDEEGQCLERIERFFKLENANAEVMKIAKELKDKVYGR